MMRPTYLTITGSGASTPIPLDRYVGGYAFGVALTTPGLIYTIQYSFSDPFAQYSNSFTVSGNWVNTSDALLVNASTSRYTNTEFAPTAVRLNVTNGVSAGRGATLAIVPFGAM